MNDTNIFDSEKQFEVLGSPTEEKIFDLSNNFVLGNFSPKVDFLNGELNDHNWELANQKNELVINQYVFSEEAKNQSKDNNNITKLNTSERENLYKTNYENIDNVKNFDIKNKNEENSNVNKILNNLNDISDQKKSSSQKELKKINVLTPEDEKLYFNKLKERDQNEKLEEQFKRIKSKNGEIPSEYVFNKEKNIFEKNINFAQIEQEIKNVKYDYLNPNYKYAQKISNNLEQKILQNPEKLKENYNKNMIQKINPNDYLQGHYNKNLLKELDKQQNHNVNLTGDNNFTDNFQNSHVQNKQFHNQNQNNFDKNPHNLNAFDFQKNTNNIYNNPKFNGNHKIFNNKYQNFNKYGVTNDKIFNNPNDNLPYNTDVRNDFNSNINKRGSNNKFDRYAKSKSPIPNRNLFKKFDFFKDIKNANPYYIDNNINDNLKKDINNKQDNDFNYNNRNQYNFNQNNKFYSRKNSYDNSYYKTGNKYEKEKETIKLLEDCEPNYRVRKTYSSRILSEFLENFNKLFYKVSVPDCLHTELKHKFKLLDEIEMTKTSDIKNKFRKVKEVIKTFNSALKEELIIYYMFLSKCFQSELNLKEKKIHIAVEPINAMKIKDNETDKLEKFNYNKDRRDKSPYGRKHSTDTDCKINKNEINFINLMDEGNDYSSLNSEKMQIEKDFQKNRNRGKSRSQISNISKKREYPIKDKKNGYENKNNYQRKYSDSSYEQYNNQKNKKIHKHNHDAIKFRDKSRSRSNYSKSYYDTNQDLTDKNYHDNCVKDDRSYYSSIERNRGEKNHSKNNSKYNDTKYKKDNLKFPEVKIEEAHYYTENKKNSKIQNENFNSPKLNNNIIPSVNCTDEQYSSPTFNYGHNKTDGIQNIDNLFLRSNLSNLDEDSKAQIVEILRKNKQSFEIDTFSKMPKVGNSQIDSANDKDNYLKNYNKNRFNSISGRQSNSHQADVNNFDNSKDMNIIEKNISYSKKDNSFSFDNLNSPNSKIHYNSFGLDLNENRNDNNISNLPPNQTKDLPYKEKDLNQVKNFKKKSQSDNNLPLLKIEQDIHSKQTNLNKKSKGKRKDTDIKKETSEEDANNNFKKINNKKINNENTKEINDKIQKEKNKKNQGQNKPNIREESSQFEKGLNQENSNSINILGNKKSESNPNFDGKIDNNLLGKKRKNKIDEEKSDLESLQIKKIASEKKLDVDPTDDLFENSEIDDDIGDGKFKEKEKQQLKKEEIIDISKLILDDGKKCLGHKSFVSMEKFIGKHRVKNLNEYMRKHENKLLSDSEKKNGVIFFKNEIENFIIALRVNKNDSFVIYNSKKLVISKE